MRPEEVGGTLSQLEVDDTTVQYIVNILREQHNELDRQKVDDTRPASFGPSAQGGTLAYHTGRARAHVVEAIEHMVTGLHDYQRGMQDWHGKIKDADHDSATTLNRLRDGGSCLDPGFPDPAPTCRPEGS